AIYRHAIENEMVQGHEQPVFVIAQPDKSGSQQWPPSEIEGLPQVLRRQAQGLRLPLGLRKSSQVRHREPDRWGRIDNLDHAPVHGREGRSPCFMAPDDLVEAALERRRVERALPV